MKKLLIAMTATAALSVAVPAAAQVGLNTNVNANASINLQNRIAALDTRLQTGLQTGAINQTEARSLRQQVRALRQLERQYSRNGLTQAERQTLQQRLRTVRQQFRMADGGGNGQGIYADNDEMYGQNGAYGQGGYNNGAYNNGAYNNGQGGYYGQGGPYEEIREGCSNSGGGVLGRVIGGILGGGGSNNCLDIGDRATSNLMAVPYQYQNQFRDGNGIVYRSDGQRIYQIDARTSTVLRIYGLNR
jgi:hypothetical protein